MKRLLLVVATVALVATACASASASVATVGDTELTRSDVESLVRDSDDILDSEFLTYLGVAIQWAAVEAAAGEQFGISPTDDEIDARLNALVVSAGAPDLETYLESVNASESGIRRYATQLIIQDAVAVELADQFEPPTDEDVAAELEAFPLDWVEVCASHILVETAAEAEAVQTRLASGEAFNEVASDVSTDPGSGPGGGDLGCSSPSQFVEEFANATVQAEIGVPTDPVETQFGFHIIRVDSREEADPDLVRQYLEGQAQAEAIDGWFLDVIESASVTVDDSVGTWTIDPSPAVLPPS